MATPLGSRIPPGDEYAVSVSWPEWNHVVAWGRKEEQLVSQLQGGYPRFFIPHQVRALAKELVKRAVSWGLLEHQHDGELALIFPHAPMAKECQQFLEAQLPSCDKVTILMASFEAGMQNLPDLSWIDTQCCSHERLFIITYPEALSVHAKAFWMHTGSGISSRCAAYWLANLASLTRARGEEAAEPESLPHEEAISAKLRIRKRIAKQASSSLATIEANDVTLFHTGMCAIFHSGRLVRNSARPSSRSTQVVVFGFLYVDTSKVLERILGFSVIHYSHGSSKDLDKLESSLKDDTLHIDALYLEFPGNPLLQSPDLHRIWSLSRKFGFLVVLDDTVATTSLSVVPWCDIVCTSLTKMFSGACNVMGGSLVLNPHSEHHMRLRAALQNSYVDTYFPLDAIVMDNNSADIQHRMSIASRNAEHLAALIQKHPQVAEVFYPIGSKSQRFYDTFKREEAGYGYLLSLRFVTPSAAYSFYNALDVAKGPSLGTNFTLCCAYTWPAHASEMEWAAEHGVVEDLVRISTGIEDWHELERVFTYALAAASYSLL